MDLWTTHKFMVACFICSRLRLCKSFAQFLEYVRCTFGSQRARSFTYISTINAFVAFTHNFTAVRSRIEHFKNNQRKISFPKLILNVPQNKMTQKNVYTHLEVRTFKHVVSYETMISVWFEFSYSLSNPTYIHIFSRPIELLLLFLKY